MKINAGNFKYRNLEIPKEARPTSEKVREAVFSMINQDIHSAVVLDLFAGSGSLGLEALSRGAKKCYFNEVSAKNIVVLKDNVSLCKAEEMSEISKSDFRRCLSQIGEKLDIIFLDPPYSSGYYDEAINLIAENEMLSSGGIIVAEHDIKKPLNEEYGNIKCVKKKKYGTIGVDIFINA